MIPRSSDVSGPPESGAAALVRRQRAGQELAVDTALGLATLGMFPALLSPVMVVTVLLLGWMLWTIGRLWGWSWPHHPIPLIGGYLNALGAFAIALLTWVAIVLLGLWIPLIDHYALSGALLSGTWTLGSAANHFYMSGFLRRLDPHQIPASHG